MQYKVIKQSLALLAVSIMIMQAENKESKQPCSVKALTLTLALEKINFLIDFINDNFKTDQNEE